MESPDIILWYYSILEIYYSWRIASFTLRHKNGKYSDVLNLTGHECTVSPLGNYLSPHQNTWLYVIQNIDGVYVNKSSATDDGLVASYFFKGWRNTARSTWCPFSLLQ
jgi:hypothetical protein